MVLIFEILFDVIKKKQLKCRKTLYYMIEGHYNMDFNPRQTPAEVLKEGSFEACFQNMYSDVILIDDIRILGKSLLI